MTRSSSSQLASGRGNRVLQIRSAFEDSGPGTQSLAIGNELRRRGFTVEYAAAGGALFSVIADAGFRTIEVPGLALDRRDPWNTVKTIAQLARILRSGNYDVVHSHNAAATFLSHYAAKLAGVTPRLVRSVRGIEVRETHQWRNWLYRVYPAQMLAVSEFTRKQLVRVGADPNRIQVTYNGVDLSRFDPRRHDGQALRANMGIGGELVFGHIGAFSGWKGQEVLVRAFSTIQDRIPPAHLVFVGDGPARLLVEREARRLGVGSRVHFAGFRTDVESFHAVFDVYCQPSTRGEMLPNAILEAMAMGKPWVGSDISGLAELSAEGRAAFLAPPGDSTRLSEHLVRLACDPELRSAMGKIGRLEVETRFTIEAVVDRLERAYGTSRA